MEILERSVSERFDAVLRDVQATEVGKSVVFKYTSEHSNQTLQNVRGIKATVECSLNVIGIYLNQELSE